LTCAVSASGNRLDPVYIIKNKSVTAELSMYGEHFDYGLYGVQHSPSGWQDTVSI